MGFYTVNHSGSTKVNKGTDKNPKKEIISFEKDQPIKDVKKGDLEHIEGAEYHTGDAKDYDPEEDSEKK